MDVNELVRVIQEGREDLIPELWDAVRRLIAFHAKRFSLEKDLGRYGVDLNDLIQNGYFALLEALRKHDPDKGSFTNYLQYHLKNAFMDAIGRTDRKRLDMLNRCKSFDELIDPSDPEGDTIFDLIPDPHDDTGELIERLYNDGLHEALEAALATIPQGEADIIRAAYWKGMSLTAIAEETGTTFSEIHNAHAKGLRHLRKGLTRAEIERYIDERTPFYRTSSLTRFNQTRTSVVEELTILRDGLERKYGESFRS